jgi:hypothetical protein
MAEHSWTRRIAPTALVASIVASAAYLVVNTKFWENDRVEEDIPVTVFRTVHVGDIVKAYEEDDLDPDDFIGSDKVGRGRGTLVFEGDDAKYVASYQRGAC